MLQVTQITRINGIVVSVKFNNGVTRYKDTETGQWIAVTPRELKAINVSTTID